MRYPAWIAFAVTLNLLGPLTAQAADGMQTAAPAFTRDQARSIIAGVQKIVSPQGIDESLQVTLGGTQQWITVRGRDSRNPILLYLHGGPASPEMPTSWTFQDDWEDFFTVVQWDQRGSGKSYNANDPEKIRPTLSIERMTDDAAELVQYLRAKYGKNKVFVLGHSWGSVLGMRLAQEHPEWLYAYIGMGQIINMQDGERLSYAAALDAAKTAGNAQAIKELESIAPYPEANGDIPFDKINIERTWSVYFGGLTYNRDSYDYYFDAGRISPDYSEADFAAIGKGSALSLPTLLPQLAKVDFSKTTEFRCPIIMFNGRHDYTTPFALVADWFKQVHAPYKKLVWFEDSAHLMQIEQPGQVLMHLVDDVLPLAGDQKAAPDNTLFVILYKQGPAWKEGVPMRQQDAIVAHFKYMKLLFDEGTLLDAGPTMDKPGGVVILQATGLDAATARMAADPSVTSGMFVGEIHSWSPAFHSPYPLPAPPPTPK